MTDFQGLFKGFLRPRGMVLECFLEVSGDSFCGVRQRLHAVSGKVSSPLVFQLQDQGSPLAKPCKPYSRSCKNRRGPRSAECPFNGTPMALILPPKTLPSHLQIGSKIYVIWDWVSSLGFLVFWCLPEVHFGSLFAPMMGDPAAQN